MWKRGEESDGEESKRYKEKSAEHFVASAKLNPGDGASFRFLGHYYSRDSLDVQRAAKCYQRAVNLNADDFEAGVSELGFFYSSSILFIHSVEDFEAGDE